MSTSTSPAATSGGSHGSNGGGAPARRSLRVSSDYPNYTWLVPSNTTLGVLLSMISASIRWERCSRPS